MSSRKKNARDRKRRPAADPLREGESRAVEGLTIAWMISALTTLLCQTGAWIGTWMSRSDPGNPGLALLAWLLSFSAIMVGLLTLGLTVAAIKMRTEPTPRAVTIGAVIAGLLPLAALMW